MSDQPQGDRGLTRKHWYFISRWYCVLCGRSDEIRERRYTPKPADPSKRCEYIENACGDHFA